MQNGVDGRHWHLQLSPNRPQAKTAAVWALDVHPLAEKTKV
jgi:hypothetical protein